MSVRGVFQLRKLQTFFCDWSGSSKGTRQFLDSPQLKAFMAENPQIQFEFIMRRGRHPYISASYINARVKDQPLKNCTPEEIEEFFGRLRGSTGADRLKHEGRKVYGTQNSIQGGWRPNMWSNYPTGTLQRFQKPMKIKLPEVVDVRDAKINQFKEVQKDLIKDTYAKLEKQAKDIDFEGNPR